MTDAHYNYGLVITGLGLSSLRSRIRTLDEAVRKFDVLSGGARQKALTKGPVGGWKTIRSRAWPGKHGLPGMLSDLDPDTRKVDVFVAAGSERDRPDASFVASFVEEVDALQLSTGPAEICDVKGILVVAVASLSVDDDEQFKQGLRALSDAVCGSETLWLRSADYALPLGSSGRTEFAEAMPMNLRSRGVRARARGETPALADCVGQQGWQRLATLAVDPLPSRE